MGKKMFMKTFGSSGYASSLILYQTFKNTVADLTGLNVPTTTLTTYVNGLYSGLPNESIAITSAATSYVKTPNHTRFSFENKASFTIAIAFKLNAVNIYTFILHKSGSSWYENAEYYLFVLNGMFTLRLIDSVNIGYVDYKFGVISAGVNYVAVISYSEDNEATCKINDVSKTVTKATSGVFTSMHHGAAQLELYECTWNPAIKASGTVDTLAMFNKDLTSVEMTDIYTKITTNQSLL